jgi:hypothetical protein
MQIWEWQKRHGGQSKSIELMQYVNAIYVDGSNVAFPKYLKSIVGEPMSYADGDEQTAKNRAVQAVNLSTDRIQMLLYMQTIVRKGTVPISENIFLI